jgi:phosphoglycerate dehydrogenase-like enzyme
LSLVPVFAGPEPVSSELADAIDAGGGVLTSLDSAKVLIWADHTGEGLAECLDGAQQVEWVQLSSAGVDWLFNSNMYRNEYLWTCAKGDVFGGTVAEMAVGLLLAWFREISTFARERTWSTPGGRPLRGSTVCVVGAGGVGSEVVRRLEGFDVKINVVRRHRQAWNGHAVYSLDDIGNAVADADATILAIPLTALTYHLVDRELLSRMKSSSVLVNVARGGLVDTDSLVDALSEGTIAGAALDVTEPEPLPAGHPLWSMPNVIVTPHTANIDELSKGEFANRVTQNLRRWNRGVELEGVIDAIAGY